MINKIKEMYKQQEISEQVYDFSEKICADLEERFKKVDKIAEYNQLKVIGAMQKNKVAEAHFNTTTGYGYNDLRKRNFRKSLCRCFSYRGCISKTTDYHVELTHWHIALSC